MSGRDLALALVAGLGVASAVSSRRGSRGWSSRGPRSTCSACGDYLSRYDVHRCRAPRVAPIPALPARPATVAEAERALDLLRERRAVATAAVVELEQAGAGQTPACRSAREVRNRLQEQTYAAEDMLHAMQRSGSRAARVVEEGDQGERRVPIDLLPNDFTPEGWVVVADVDSSDGTEQIHLTVHVDHEDGERYFVGWIAIAELPAADESDCRGLKRLARSNPRIPAWYVSTVQLQPAFIGHGLGISLYLLAAQAAVQWTRGPVILARDECRPGGETSEMADHAWRRLSLRPEVAKAGRPQAWSANAEAVLVTPESLGIPVTSRLQGRAATLEGRDVDAGPPHAGRAGEGTDAWVEERVPTTPGGGGVATRAGALRAPLPEAVVPGIDARSPRCQQLDDVPPGGRGIRQGGEQATGRARPAARQRRARTAGGHARRADRRLHPGARRRGRVDRADAGGEPRGRGAIRIGGPG